MIPCDKIVAIDFETGTDHPLLTGLDVWHPEVRVESMALSRFKNGELVSYFYDTPADIEKALTKISDKKLPVLVYNATFEALVLHCKYPHLDIKIASDTMRLAQQEMTQVLGGFGLKSATKHFFPERADYEKEIYSWIEQNVTVDGKKPKKSELGRYLSQAPRDILKRYNVADTELTLLIYQHILHLWAEEGYPESKVDTDHKIYLDKVNRLVKAKAYGVRVDREQLAKNIESTKQALADIETAFFKEHADSIQKVRELLWDSLIEVGRSKVKTDKGRANWTRETKPCPEFNIASKHHLAKLFVDVQGQSPKLFTPTGMPSLKAAHLGQFEGTELLLKRGMYVQALGQMENIYALSQFDGRWRPDLKAAGTKTGRLTGGN